MPDPDTTSAPRLLLITGAGRSGTSTVSGALKRLGLHIPQPEVPPDESNPRGFYEPQWVVDFHKRLLGSIPVRNNDARPGAAELARTAGAAPEMRDRLVTWLGEQVEVARGTDVVVKDPRAFWFHDLWKAAAGDVGVDIAFLTMLRHPVEVVRSRETHYLQGEPEEIRSVRQTASIAGWLNGAFQTDLATRGSTRAYVRYVDLMADWRIALGTAARQLGLALDPDAMSDRPHPVDDFIDTKLHRARVTWDDVETLPELRELAQVAWEALNELVDDPSHPASLGALDEAGPRYARLYGYAEAVTLHHTSCEVVKERRRAQEAARKEVRRLRQELRTAQQGAARGSQARWRRIAAALRARSVVLRDPGQTSGPDSQGPGTS